MRTDARNELELDLVRMGAEGVVVREMETQITERKCPIVPLRQDHVVQATIVGTAIAQFARDVAAADLRDPQAGRAAARQPPQRQLSVSLEGERRTATTRRPPGRRSPVHDQPVCRQSPGGAADGIQQPCQPRLSESSRRSAAAAAPSPNGGRADRRPAYRWRPPGGTGLPGASALPRLPQS